MQLSRLVYFSNAGVPETGLTPTWTLYRNVETLVDATAPAITEIGSGWYKFPDNIIDFDHIVAVLDGGVGLGDADRYKFLEFKQEDLKGELEVKIGQVYDEDTDSLTFMINGEQKGTLIQSGITSIAISVYDISNTAIMSGSDSTLNNGIGTIIFNNPTIAKNEIYYVLATLTLSNGATVLGATTYQVIE